MDEEELVQLRDDDIRKAEINADLAELERLITISLTQNNARTAVQMAFEHACITGSSLLEKTEDGKWRVYRLDNYVIVRQPDGRILEIITRDVIDPAYIPDDISISLDQTDHDMGVALYQYVKYKGNGMWEKQIQLKDTVLETVEMNYNPFIVARWKPTINEHYGRSHVEENVGDLRVYEALQCAMKEGAAIMSQLNPLVDPSQPYTKIQDLLNAENGMPIPGRGQDIAYLETNKVRDFGWIAAYAAALEERLGYSFAVPSSVQPQGERVTATQIRSLAGELDAVLGGIFESITQELIQPMVELEYRSLMDQTKYLTEDLPVQVKLTTGIEALGREQDRANVLEIIQLMQADPEFREYHKIENLLQKYYVSRNIDPSDLLKTQEEVQQDRAAQQAQQQAIQSLGTIAEQQATP